MAGWQNPYTLLHEELIQCRDEGAVIPNSLLKRVQQLDPVKDLWNLKAIDPLYDELISLPINQALETKEPSELSEIKKLRPQGPRDLNWKPSDEELLDRLHGAWTGRATGCALGKPVEIMGFAGENGRLTGRQNIRKYLENRGDWPLKDYFSGRVTNDGLKLICELSHRENIAFMEADDDIHYSLTGLGVLEQYSPSFTWQNVARYWMEHIPVAYICTAERQAILNFQNQASHWEPTAATNEFTRAYHNPYREWIGAQIRADGWAWACAGKPELAAEFAYRDAGWTHTRNGIYGEMFFAAMQAAAFVEPDPAKLVQIGLSEIPSDCRLAVLIRQCLQWVKESNDWETCVEKVEKACALISPWHYGGTERVEGMNPVHTFNNAAICVLSLFYGKMDTVESITTSIMCGLDTDCNGATVGSIVGAASGRRRFKNDLAGRLHDTIKPNMLGFQEVKMKDLAQRTLAVWKNVDNYGKQTL
jgi:hypothetical protein